jgi:hypothetical protein
LKPPAKESDDYTTLDRAIASKQVGVAITSYESGLPYDSFRRGAFIELLRQDGLKLEHLLLHGIIPDVEMETQWTILEIPGISESDCWSAYASRRTSEEFSLELIRPHGAWGAARFSTALSPDGRHFAMVVGAFIGVFGLEDGTEATFPHQYMLDGTVTVQFAGDSSGLFVGSSRHPVLYNFRFRELGPRQVAPFFDFTRFVVPGQSAIGFEVSRYGGWLLMYDRKAGFPEIFIFHVGEPKLLKSLLLPDVLSGACFSPDGEKILLQFRDVMTLWEWRAEIRGMTTFPNGQAIFLSSDEVVLYGSSPTRLKSIENKRRDRDFSWSTETLASSADQRFLATSYGQCIYLYDSRTGQLKCIIMEELPEDDESSFQASLVYKADL